MVTAKTVIETELGLNLRPAGLLCERAQTYASNIQFRKENTEVNAKSVISVLSAGIRSGDELEIICEGEDEQEALDGLIDFIQHGL